MDPNIHKSTINLSDEVLIHILHLCNYQEILRFAGTCRRFGNLVSNTVGLQLHIELEANGLEVISGPGKGNTNYRVVLEDLRRYLNAWLDLDLDKPVERYMKNRIVKWKVDQSCYAAASVDLTGLTRASSLELIPLESSKFPDTINVGQTFHEFYLDRKQDLVVLANVQDQNKQCAELELRSIHSGFPHPLAQHPMITIQVDFEIDVVQYEVFLLGVMDHLLAVKIDNNKTPSYELLIFDWRLGTLINRIGPTPQRSVCEFAFLDKDRLVLVSGSAIEHGTEPGSVRLMIYDICPQPPLSSRPGDGLLNGPDFLPRDIACSRPTQIFEFPELCKRYRFSLPLYLWAGPIPGYAIYTKSVAFTYPRLPTLYLPLTLENSSGDSESEVYLRIFVDVDSLLRSASGGPFRIPWSAWGPQSTRCFFNNEKADSWVHFISGTRHVRVNDEEQTSSDLSVFDFNPRIVRRHVSSHLGAMEYQDNLRDLVSKGPESSGSMNFENTPGTVEIVGRDLPTVITEVFMEPVESCLPYRVVTKQVNLWAERWTIDGEYIVGVNSMELESAGEEDSDDEIPDKITIFKLRT